MTRRPEEIQPTPTQATPEPPPDGQRRRFIAAGLAAAPLLVTLTARPASAQTAYAYGYTTP